jgi:hypothetical protein
VPTRCTWDEAKPAGQLGRGTPLVRALALQGVSGNSGSHLGSTLKPGGAVLTLGVSRRSRSVAYIPADASPSEVLASAIVPLEMVIVNSPRSLLRCVAATGSQKSPLPQPIFGLVFDDDDEPVSPWACEHLAL